MNVLDLLLIFVLLVSVWIGYNKGFILGTVNLLTRVGSLLIGFLFYSYFATFLHKLFPALGVWTLPLSFILTILLARILLTLLFNPVLRFTNDEPHSVGVNKLLGTLLGFINGLINATILVALLLATSLLADLSSKTRASKLVNKLVMPAEWMENKLSPIFSKAVEQTLNKRVEESQSYEFTKLNFTVTGATIRFDLEAKMLDLINEERRKAGLQTLEADPDLTIVARAHSQDMFARSYFAHINPDGKDPFDRIKAAHIRFLAAGENLALAQTLTLAHTGLMNSPGHRANILQLAFGRVGIGILDGGIYGLMITQNFRN